MIDGVLTDRMTSDNHADLIRFYELIDDIWSVVHDVVLLHWVSVLVPRHSQVGVIDGWIRPKRVHGHLLYRISDFSEVDLERPRNLLEFFNLVH